MINEELSSNVNDHSFYLSLFIPFFFFLFLFYFPPRNIYIHICCCCFYKLKMEKINICIHLFNLMSSYITQTFRAQLFHIHTILHHEQNFLFNLFETAQIVCQFEHYFWKSTIVNASKPLRFCFLQFLFFLVISLALDVLNIVISTSFLFFCSSVLR